MEATDKAQNTELNDLFFIQHHLTRMAFDKSYARRMFEVSMILFKRITIKKLNKVDDLFLVTVLTDQKDAATTMESWKAYYNWSTRQLIEIGGKKRVLYVETGNDVLYMESGAEIPFVVETFNQVY